MRPKDSNTTIIEAITLFGAHTVSAHEARTAILAHSGADLIREWRAFSPTTDAPDLASRCYAGIRLPLTAAETASVIGHGATPTAAIADLLWQVVTPLLLDDTP